MTTTARLRLALVATLVALLAGCEDTPATPPDASSTTTTVVTDGTTPPAGPPWCAPTDPVPFPGASWTCPAESIGYSTDPQLHEYARRLALYAGNLGQPNGWRPGDLGLQTTAYSVPIYDLDAPDVGTARVWLTDASLRISPPGIAPGSLAPWSTSWNIPAGSDRLLIARSPTTGMTWTYWGAGGSPLECFGATLLGADWSRDVCAANVWATGNTTDLSAATADERGSGLPKLAGIVTADEVARGRIGHALNLTIAATMYGPACPSVADATSPGAGVTCGHYLAPARKLEWNAGPTDANGPRCNNAPPADLGRPYTVPAGLRVVLDISPAELAAWLDDHAPTEPLRSTLETFADAMRTDGLMVTETSCWGAAIETTGHSNPTESARWTALGLPPELDTSRILAGLIRPDNLRPVNPTP